MKISVKRTQRKPAPPRKGGNFHKILYGDAQPRGPTPYPFVCHFDRKDTHFVHLLLKNVSLSRTLHPFLNLWNDVKELYYERTSSIPRRDVNQKARNIYSVPVIHYTLMTDFPTLLLIPQLVKSVPF